MCLVEGGVYILPRRVGQQHLLGLPHLPTPPPHSLVSPQPAPRRPRRRHSAPRLMGESSTDVIKDTDSSIFRHALYPRTPRFASRRPSPTHPARRAPGRACSAQLSREAGLTCLDPACVVAGQRGAPASTHATSLSTPLPPPSHPGPTKPSLTIVLQMRHCGPGQSDKDSHTACPHPAPPRPAPPRPARHVPRLRLAQRRSPTPCVPSRAR